MTLRAEPALKPHALTNPAASSIERRPRETQPTGGRSCTCSEAALAGEQSLPNPANFDSIQVAAKSPLSGRDPETPQTQVLTCVAPIVEATRQHPGSDHSFGRSPSRWIAQDYTVREKYVVDIVSRLKFKPEVDAFASSTNRRCIIWWGEGSSEAEDAFQQIGAPRPYG